MSFSSIHQLLVAPSRIAHALNWRKATGKVMALGIAKNSIDVAIVSHPTAIAAGNTSPRWKQPLADRPIPSIRLGSKVNKENKIQVIDDSVMSQLSSIVQRHADDLCGIVVSWPVQEEGWCGAPCGRVLHALDQIVEHEQRSHGPQHPLLSLKRPICLWDYQHHGAVVDPEDAWGRAELYSHTTTKTEHVASKEQYSEPPCTAALIWDDFMRAHWPDLCNVSQVPSRSEHQQYATQRPSLVQRRPTSWSNHESLYLNA
jgi:hypothetical protein